MINPVFKLPALWWPDFSTLILKFRDIFLKIYLNNYFEIIKDYSHYVIAYRKGSIVCSEWLQNFHIFSSWHFWKVKAKLIHCPPPPPLPLKKKKSSIFCNMNFPCVAPPGVAAVGLSQHQVRSIKLCLVCWGHICNLG